VRIDDGVREGDTISPFYDSMIAKLIVHGDTREQALARLDQALAQTQIVGLATNVQFLRHVVRSHSFSQAELDTALITREQAVLFEQDPVGLARAVSAVVADTVHREMMVVETTTGWQDPCARRDGWRSHGLTTRTFAFEYLGQSHEVGLVYERDGSFSLRIGADAPQALRWQAQGDDGLLVEGPGGRWLAQVYRQGEVAHVFTPLGATRVLCVDRLAHAGEAAEEGGRLTAPMPGKVVSFAVKAGDKVKPGQVLAVMEAMKMEHTLTAPAEGDVLELLYAPGDQVTEGAELLRLST
jgi:3-methylcrotonyl-CoA carboxylase alpha subunit